MSSQEQEAQIQQLGLIEQNLNNLLMQRQSFTTQMNETESALIQLRTKPSAFKIIGNIMIETGSAELVKELTHKKELLSLRIKNLQKQEQQLQQKAKTIQDSVMKNMKKSG